MKLIIHQTDFNIADFAAIENYLEQNLTNEGLHLFCELYLTGYPLQDLCLQKSFVDRYHRLLNSINQKSQALPKNAKIQLLIGGLDYELTELGQPKIIKNVIFQLTPGEKLKNVYTKRLLPSYDIFDEAKYFVKGHDSCVLNLFGKNIGLMICEDMWPSNIYEIDPAVELEKYCQDKKIKLDTVVNLSASPFNIGKHQKRLDRANTISKMLNCPFAYVNRVGGEDEILFDGQSFVMSPTGPNLILEKFKAQTSDIEIETKMDQLSLAYKNSGSVNTWEDLLNANLTVNQNVISLTALSEDECQEMLDGLTFGLKEYAKKCGFKKFLVALSGGIDSALVLSLAKLALTPDQEIEAVYMPSQYSAPLSWELCHELCQNLKIPLRTFPIKFLHSTVKNNFFEAFNEELAGLADENVQSRLRGMLIYTRSNISGAMVINTSNKSELAVGYSTQYGDSVGAISVLGDVYKSEVFQLASYINQKYNSIIPEGLITRPPTAELRLDQKDTDSLPPYDVLDAILEGILSFQYSRQDLVKYAFSTHVVEKVFNLYRNSEYKRSQFCPIIKVKGKSFGFGYRIPTSKNSKFYLE